MTSTSSIENQSYAKIDAAVALASEAASTGALSYAGTRIALLNGLADALEAHKAELVALADQETGLGEGRLNGELARTAFQLRGFADQVDARVPYRVVDDEAIPGAPPQGRPHLTRVTLPIGPVAMFSASNFPFAFSVLGGDTASALAAGCPVIVKAHPGHAGLSRAVFEIASSVLTTLRLAPGVLTMLQSLSRDEGSYLVRHPSVSAVAFTGSYQGGVALWRAANDRPRPIPFFGELGSINPLVILPASLADGVDDPAKVLAGSIALGCGQFCTSPGLILVPTDSTGQAFTDALAAALNRQSPHRMLTEGIRAGFDAAVRRLHAHPRVRHLSAAQSIDASQSDAPAAQLFEVDASDFLSDSSLSEEIFGPAALIVRVNSHAARLNVLQKVGGTLTATLWGANEESPENRVLIQQAEAIAGRVLFAGVPTGVAVTEAQQHGGPWPASTQPATTSVGYAALERFLRPVALQDAPSWLIESWQGGTVS